MHSLTYRRLHQRLSWAFVVKSFSLMFAFLGLLISNTSLLKAQQIRGPQEALRIISVRATSSQASSTFPANLTNGNGLDHLFGEWEHSNDAFRDRGIETGTMWASGECDGNFDEHPELTFEFDGQEQVGSMHVWNYNQPGWNGGGVKNMEILASEDGRQFKVVGKVTIPCGSALPGDPGFRFAFKDALNVRAITLRCISNWQGYGRFGLSEVRFFKNSDGTVKTIDNDTPFVDDFKPEPNVPNPPRQAVAGGENIVFPSNSGVIDVTAAPYFAKGDGIADDTKAIQQALNDYPSCGAIIYLPNGTYRITRTIHWPMGRDEAKRQKLTCLQGQSRRGVTIQLSDHCVGFQDLNAPREMLNTGGYPAQRFFNSVRNCTIDVGSGNPGAIGLRFNSSNCGSLRDVELKGRPGSGYIGLDQSYTDDYGPTFVKNLSIIGFDIGISVAHGVNGIVYENIAIRNARKVAIENRGMPITFRNLEVINSDSVPAIRNLEWYGFITLVDSKIVSNQVTTAPDSSAIENRDGGLFVRNTTVKGYGSAIRHYQKDLLKDDLVSPTGEKYIPHWSSSGLLNGSGQESLGLAIKETPDVAWDSPDQWAVISDFGGKTDDDIDDSEAIQRAMDCGKPTVCFPRGKVVITKPIVIRGHVRRVIGTEAELILPTPLPMGTSIFTVEAGAEPILVVERLISLFWNNHSNANWIENPTGRTLVLRDIGDVENCERFEKGNVITGPGELFLEDVVGRFDFQPGQKIWARWINPETNVDQRQKTPESQWHLINNGADLWILGIKTEGPGPVLITRRGGRSEVLGGLMYSSGGSREKQHRPAFVFQDSTGNVSITEANFTDTAYEELIQVSRDGDEVFMLRRGETPGAPGGSMIPFWSTPSIVPNEKKR